MLDWYTTIYHSSFICWKLINDISLLMLSLWHNYFIMMLFLVKLKFEPVGREIFLIQLKKCIIYYSLIYRTYEKKYWWFGRLWLGTYARFSYGVYPIECLRKGILRLLFIKKEFVSYLDNRKSESSVDDAIDGPDEDRPFDPNHAHTPLAFQSRSKRPKIND